MLISGHAYQLPVGIGSKWPNALMVKKKKEEAQKGSKTIYHEENKHFCNFHVNETTKDLKKTSYDDRFYAVKWLLHTV